MVFANKCVLAVCGQQHISALSQLYAVRRFLPAQAAVATTMFPFDIHSYCVEISTLVWEKLFLPLQLKTISITQLKPHVICLCRVKETNQCMVVASKPINMRPAKMGGASGYIIRRLPLHLRFLLFSDEDPSWLTFCWRRVLPLKRLSSSSGVIKVQGFFICHIINYTGYNQKWNVNQIRSAQWTVQKNKNKNYIKVTQHKSIYGKIRVKCAIE